MVLDRLDVHHGALMYRKDILAANGFTNPPKTWADVGTMCRKIIANTTDSEMACYITQFLGTCQWFLVSCDCIVQKTISVSQGKQ